MSLADTIVAIATPNGVGALGIVRLSGSAATGIVENFFDSNPKISVSEPWRALYGKIISENSDPIRQTLQPSFIDWAVAVKYEAPKSFTGEDMVEITTHGSPLILRETLALALKNGAREALPGEFTQRAFINGKLDLVQAEAICGLIRSQSKRALKLHAQAASGLLSKKIENLRDKLFDILAKLDVLIDHPDEPEIAQDFNPSSIGLEIEKVKTGLESSMKSFEYAYKVRAGLSLVVAGAPNAGKSTLFNSLINRDRAMVSSIAGTTRDTVEEYVELGGLLVKIIDTAGLQETADTLAQESVRRSREAIAAADGVIWVIDGTKNNFEQDIAFPPLVQGKPVLIAWNKKDQAGFATDRTFVSGPFPKIGEVAISAKLGAGLDELKTLVSSFLERSLGDDAPGLWEERHLEHGAAALEHLSKAQARMASELWDLASAEVRAALTQVSAILGKDDITDGLMRKIFSKFCVGK